MSDRPTSFCALIKPVPVQSPLHSNSSPVWLAVSVVPLLFGWNILYCSCGDCLWCGGGAWDCHSSAWLLLRKKYCSRERSCLLSSWTTTAAVKVGTHWSFYCVVATRFKKFLGFKTFRQVQTCSFYVTALLNPGLSSDSPIQSVLLGHHVWSNIISFTVMWFMCAPVTLPLSVVLCFPGAKIY